MYSNILNTLYSFSYLCTNRLNQDPLENEFAIVRRICGSNDSPTAHQFAAAIKNSSIFKNIDTVENTNCRKTQDSNLVKQNGTIEKRDRNPLKFEGEAMLQTRNFEPLDFENVQTPNAPEVNALTYTIGNQLN